MTKQTEQNSSVKFCKSCENINFEKQDQCKIIWGLRTWKWTKGFRPLNPFWNHHGLQIQTRNNFKGIFEAILHALPIGQD